MLGLSAAVTALATAPAPTARASAAPPVVDVFSDFGWRNKRKCKKSLYVIIYVNFHYKFWRQHKVKQSCSTQS